MNSEKLAIEEFIDYFNIDSKEIKDSSFYKYIGDFEFYFNGHTYIMYSEKDFNIIEKYIIESVYNNININDPLTKKIIDRLIDYKKSNRIFKNSELAEIVGKTNNFYIAYE